MGIKWLHDERTLAATEAFVVFGAGVAGRDVARYLISRGKEVACYCDNDPGKAGSDIDGVPVVSPETLQGGERRPVVIASEWVVDIYRQLRDSGITEIILGYGDSPLKYLHLLDMDEPSPEDSRCVLVLPPAALTREFYRRAVDWFERRFAGARVLDVAQVGGASGAAPVADERVVRIADLDRLVKAYDRIVFLQAESAERDWRWNPVGYRYLEPRIYVLFFWGQFRCVNRAVDAEDLPVVDDHIFWRLSRYDRFSLNVYFPYGFLTRDASRGVVDSMGFRIARSVAAIRARGENERLICLFGGSAAWGSGCLDDEMLSTRLERRLNEWAEEQGVDERFMVLNFAQPSAVVLNELSVFLLYAANLRPDVVIAHDGFNDLYYGQSSDPFLLQQHAITYQDALEGWASTLHGGGEVRGAEAASATRARRVSADDVIRSYLNRVDHFRTVVESFGARFVWGLQPFIKSKGRLSKAEAGYYSRVDMSRSRGYVNMEFLYRQLSGHLRIRAEAFQPDIDFDARFQGIVEDVTLFDDFVHLGPEGNARVAGIYFDELVSNHFG